MAEPVSKAPGVYVDLDDLLALEQKGRNVSFLPCQPVHSLLSGRFSPRMRGRGLNFEEIRDYRPSDDVRSIRWKVTARLCKPHIGRLQREVEPAGDSGGPMALLSLLWFRRGT